MGAEKLQFHTVDDYLESELVSEIRHEYLGGAIHAMSGASRKHNEVALGIHALLRTKLKGGGCSVYAEAVKLHIKTSLAEYFYYPDVMVGCDPADNHEYYLESPSILFEVLSPSTESIDRREKLLAYQTIPSLEHYVIVAQEERRVEWLQREGNSWNVFVLTEPEERLEFPGQKTSLTLSEIYEGIEFP
jgi:Uma2 family endonuclease